VGGGGLSRAGKGTGVRIQGNRRVGGELSRAGFSVQLIVSIHLCF
jgi:hypothetical protein